jgi:hypothetical protein
MDLKPISLRKGGLHMRFFNLKSYLAGVRISAEA